MIELKSPPAFGFQTSNCNSGRFYKERGKEKFEMGFNRSQALMGLQGMPDLRNDPESQQAMDSLADFGAQTQWKCDNFERILGYIPLFGMLIGLIRISQIYKQTEKQLPNRCNHLLRGSIELCSLGFLLLIPDLIVTCNRACLARRALPLGVKVHVL